MFQDYLRAIVESVSVDVANKWFAYRCCRRVSFPVKALVGCDVSRLRQFGVIRLTGGQCRFTSCLARWKRSFMPDLFGTGSPVFKRAMRVLAASMLQLDLWNIGAPQQSSGHSSWAVFSPIGMRCK